VAASKKDQSRKALEDKQHTFHPALASQRKSTSVLDLGMARCTLHCTQSGLQPASSCAQSCGQEVHPIPCHACLQ
jgi:hypothetical protein